MTQEHKELLLKDLCARLPYGVIFKDEFDENLQEIHYIKNEDIFSKNYPHLPYWIETIKPYLRPMSSMTDDEKKEVLIYLLGKNGIKYFHVEDDGSIDSNDEAHQDLNNFNLYWVNFDGNTTSRYLDWLNAHYFDYRGLIEKGLAIEVTDKNNPYENEL